MTPIVHSPRNRWRPIHVIYNGGDDDFSMVIGFWDDEPVITGRWNGPAGAKGMPLSSGYPVPFVFPRFMWDAIINLTDQIFDEDRELAKAFLSRGKKQEAAE